MNNKTSSIPELKVVWVDTRFTHEEPIGFQEALWVQTTATPDRAWGITVVFRKGGMMYRNLPPHAIAFDMTNHETCWFIDNAQLWNCYVNSPESALRCPCFIFAFMRYHSLPKGDWQKTSDPRGGTTAAPANRRPFGRE